MRGFGSLNNVPGLSLTDSRVELKLIHVRVIVQVIIEKT